MDARTMKKILVNKLRDEHTYFTSSDIKIRRLKTNDGYQVVIKDFEHLRIIVKEYTDDFFGYCLDLIIDGKIYTTKYGTQTYKYEGAYHSMMITLGYYIGTRC